jgi:hypothetical protein
MYNHLTNSPSKHHQNFQASNVVSSHAYRRRRTLHAHHHYQRVRLKSAPPTGGGFLYNFNYQESMVVSGIGSTPTNQEDNFLPPKPIDEPQMVHMSIKLYTQYDKLL